VSSSLNINASVNETVSLMALLTKRPIRCDIMLMPEFHSFGAGINSAKRPLSSTFPSSSFYGSSMIPLAMSDALYLPKNDLNPCGTSNVMILESLPWNNIPGGDNSASMGSVLVSLTSCSVLFRYHISPAGATSYHLPIEPSPSTFVLNFDANKADNTTSGSGGQLAELYVDFDVGKATSFVQKLTTRNDFASSDSAATSEDTGSIPDISHIPASTPNTCTGESQESQHGQKDEAAPLSSTHNAQQHLSTSIRDFTDQKLLLQQLHLRMDQDARYLDLSLRALGCIGVFLWGVLIWAIYQFYRSTAKSDTQTQEIRDSIKKTRRVLKDAVKGLQPQTLDQLFGQNESDHGLGNDDSVITEAIGLADPDGQIPVSSRHFPTMTSCSHELEPSHTTPGSLQHATEVHTVDSQIAADDYDAPRTPSMEVSLQDHSRPTRMHAYPASQYTLEKFEREWMERKTIRRSNRKTKRSCLRPITLGCDFPGGKKASHGSSNDRRLVGPPQLFSVVREGGNEKNAILGSKSSSTIGSGGEPIISSGSYRSDPSSRLPSLCHTPASEDDDLPADHFVYDYWF
jgi:hypothetical protein